MENKRGAGAVMTLALYSMMILALLVLVASGSRLYAALTRSRAANEARRASLSAVVNAVEGADETGAVSLKEGPEGTALCLLQGDTGYESRIYLWQGTLKLELCAREAACSPGEAETLAETSRFEVQSEGGGVLSLTTDEGSALVALRSRGGEGLG